MDYKENRSLRLGLLSASVVLMLLAYVGVLYNTQVNHYEKYMAQSIRSIAREEKVEASRGIITDRSGRALVSNRSTYNLTFDASLLSSGQDENEAILRLVELCRNNGVSWADNLPITRTAPFTYTLDQLSSLQKKRFLTYVKSLPDAAAMLGAYLLQNSAGTDSPLSTQEAVPEADRAKALVAQLTTETLTADLLTRSGVTAARFLQLMQTGMKVSSAFSADEARLILGVQYELSLRKLDNYDAYVLAEDIDTAFISLLSDGNFAGAKVSSSTVREYETTYASHILGTVGRLYKEEYDQLKDQGYGMDDWIGKDGAELAFEQYLKGSDGRRIVSSNSEGKITGEFYSEEPRPGSTVELTIDLKLQQTVEDALAETVSKMNAEDGLTTRGAGVVVEKVGTGEVLALASFPTFDLSTYRQNFNNLANKDLNPGNPLFNRATSGTYAPGSTLKPLTAIAALEEGKTTTTERIRDTGRWVYPGDSNSYANCWNLSGHGMETLSKAITDSCNYYFAEMGYRLGMDALNKYLTGFGLGEKTGIEIGDKPGVLPENKAGENQSPWAAFGQANQLYTPIQLSNYIATLVSGGKHCNAHLLKTVKSYDNAEVLAVGDTTPKNTINIRDSSLEAVKKGMHDLTTTGSLAPYFKDCLVTAGAKTGTAQISKKTKNNGVFVCFAPYDNPEIAVSIVIEKGGSGSALASTAVKILNAYFATDEIGTAVIGENQLLP